MADGNATNVSTVDDINDDCVVVAVSLHSSISTGSSDVQLSTSNADSTVTNYKDPLVNVLDETSFFVTSDGTAPSILCCEDDDDDVIWLTTLSKTEEVRGSNLLCKSAVKDNKSCDSSVEELSAKRNVTSLKRAHVDSDKAGVSSKLVVVAAVASSSSLPQHSAPLSLSGGTDDEPIIISEISPRFTSFKEPKQVVLPQEQLPPPYKDPFYNVIPSGGSGNNGFSNNELLMTRWPPLLTGLRPIAIDGSNVAFNHGRNQIFSCRGIQLCIDYFVQRGHMTVKAFVPQFRRQSDPQVSDRHILEALGNCQMVVFTPSRKIFGQNVVCHDDRFILEYADRTGAVIVSNDNFREFQTISPSWEEMIRCRLLMYTFADDVFMIPADPLGRNGPSLNQYLSF